MNTIYNTYDRFIEAAKKFPRWNNIRRRPTTSTGGKMLWSIVEEIGKVEDAILDYQKDFFIVNYIGKENKIIDYLYSAFVGEISNPESIVLKSPVLEITTDKELFYSKSKTYAYYQDGYFIFNKNIDFVEYSVGSFSYIVKAEKFYVWNIFDEFAWWIKLERFENETNEELMQRCISYFRHRPNSSTSGLKNTIYNTLLNYGHIEQDEIVFETPDQENMQLLNSDGITLYEEISKFNRDIARTKQWDVDYWDNSFRKLHYIPHVWDADVEVYKDGVGYNNSLTVSTVKDLDIDGNTDVEIQGYKKSTAKIEEYIKNKNISDTISLDLKKYGEGIDPIPIEYKINASTLTEIKNPNNIYIDAYLTSNRQIEYDIDEFVESVENITISDRRFLEPDKEYTLKIKPIGYKMEIEEAALYHDDGSIDLLKEDKNFGYNDRNIFVNKNVLFYGDAVTDFMNTENLTDYRYGGVTLHNSNTGYFEIDVTGLTEGDRGAQSLLVDTYCEPYSIMANPTYISTQDFTFVNNTYVSGSSSIIPSILTIELLASEVYFNLSNYIDGLTSGYVNIETYIEETDESNEKKYVLNHSKSMYNVAVNKFNGYSLKLNNLRKVKIVISRTNNHAIVVSDIKVVRCEIKIETSKGVDISPLNRANTTIPKTTGDYYVYVTINNYGQNNPVVNYVLVGAKINAITGTYSINFNTNGLSNPYVDVKSGCLIEIYNSDSTIISTYHTNKEYSNNTNEAQGIFLNLSSFGSIYWSNVPIEYNENSVPYIVLNPGDKISKIFIYGKREVLRSRKTLKEMLNLGTRDKIYTNKNIKGFIKDNNETQTLITLTESMVSNKDSDMYKVYTNDESLQVSFIANSVKNVETLADKYSGAFDYLYLYDKNTIDYIAYNEQKIVKNLTEDISIIKNFLPSIPENQKVLYQIEDVVHSNGYDFNIYFENKNNWAISSLDKITIETNIDLLNTSAINAEIKNLTSEFALSNHIDLKDSYLINEQEIELGQYIITPPEMFEVKYSPVTVVQSRTKDNEIIYIKDNGFNKLQHSNIVSVQRILVNGVEISENNYSLLEEEGIIFWNNPNLIGKSVEFAYTYNKPTYLTFSDIEYMYDTVGYQIDTLERIDTVNDYVVKGVTEGKIINIDYSYFKESPDKIIAQCSNPCYVGYVEDNFITIKKIADDNSIVIHNGYYYIDGKEYWYFADRLEKTAERLDGVQINNANKSGGDLILSQEAENLLLNSKMICNSMNTNCILDFNNYRIDSGISSLNKVGACDNFSSWKSYKMQIALTNDYDGHEIKFTAEDYNAYAILDITKALEKNKKISCYYSGSLKFKIGKEKLINNNQLSKSLFVEDYADFEKINQYAFYDASNLDMSYRYYLIVTGSGTLIETLITEDATKKEIEKFHTKNLSKFGLIIKEKQEEKKLVEIDFNQIGLVLENLEIDKSLNIKTGSTADWGITKIADINLQEVKKQGFLYRKGMLISQANNSLIETPPIKINYKKACLNIFLKINDYPNNELKEFNVTTYGNNSGANEYAKIQTARRVNVATVQSEKITNYLKFEISAEEGKVINHLEVFAQYRETAEQALRISSYNYGTATTKVFDVVTPGRYIVKNIEAEETLSDKIKYQVRGAKSIDGDIVWTEWYDINDKHIFNDYHLFQFKVILESSDATTKINKFILEVV